MDLLPLPASYRLYLQSERGLTDAMIDRFVLYTERPDGKWFAIPVNDDRGGVEFYKLKAVPDAKSDQPKGKVEPAGSGHRLLGRKLFNNAERTQFVICEGEFDWLLLLQHNFGALSSTAGAQSFDEEWVHLFPQDCEVVLSLDADEAGDKGREKIRHMFMELRPDVKISDVRFIGKKKGYDVTDFYLECLSDGKDFTAEFTALITPWNAPAKRERKIAPLPPPTSAIDKDEWLAFIGAHFKALQFPSEVVASVVCQLLIHDVHNPFALILTDAPSTGKTICINFFDGINGLSYSTDDYTSASFVSNIAGRSKKQLEEIDLLPRIRHKVMLVREMATMLTESDDQLRARLGQLTRVLDGEGLKVESGVYGQRGYEGEYNFMFVAASTPFPIRVWKLMSGLGHRLFFLSINAPVPSLEQLVEQSTSGSFKVKEKLCKHKTEDLIRTLWNQHKEGIDWDLANDDRGTMMWIAKLSDFLARYRGEIKVWKDTGAEGGEYDSSRPEIENPSRLNTCLSNLARGHAVLCGRTHIEPEDLGVVIAVVLNTAPITRVALMGFLLNNGGGGGVGDIAAYLKVSESTAKKEMHKFMKLGLCDGHIHQDFFESASLSDPHDVSMVPGRTQNYIQLKKEFEWWTGEELTQLCEKIGYVK